VAAAVIVPASVIEALPLLGNSRPIPWVSTWVGWLEPYHIANRYHVFPTIETERIEVQISGSLDGEHWRTYRFRYWPVHLSRVPPFAVPHQPRLDYMLWFVPKSRFFLDWLDRFLHRLLEGSPPVTGLLESTPFGKEPPRMVRVDLYRYQFTSLEERAKTGNWWRREYLGPFYSAAVARAIALSLHIGAWRQRESDLTRSLWHFAAATRNDVSTPVGERGSIGLFSRLADHHSASVPRDARRWP
jgi:hypothetical protein